MVRHLLSASQDAVAQERRVVIITGPRNNHDASERLRGYRASLRDASDKWSHELEVAGDFTEAAGHAAIGEILKLSPRPAAIFANDSMAIGALSALREAGLRVPEDIRVGGFDDIPTSRYMSPPLSSVHVAISELGEHAMSALVMAVEEKRFHVPRQDILRTTLVVRVSSGGCDRN